MPRHGAKVDVPAHRHEWERGRHMAEAFDVDGRRYYWAICGVPFWCVAKADNLYQCLTHGGSWDPGKTYCALQVASLGRS